MADPLRKVQRGQKLAKSLTASAWNQFVDNVKNDGRSGAGVPSDVIDPANTVLFVWDGEPEATLDAFSVLAYGSAINDPSVNPFVAQGRPLFNGADPSSASAPFAVTLKPIDGGKAGTVAVSGLVPVQVNIGSTSHRRAVPSPGNIDNLVSASTGGVPIVWVESGTGLKWAFVLLDFADQSSAADCSRLLDNLHPDFCGSLTVSGAGTCGCVPTESTELDWDDDEDAALSVDNILGCPPGVVTANCPDGAPRKWRVDVAGFTDPTAFNQTYTATWSSGETWTQVKVGVTITMTNDGGGDWTMTLDDGSTVSTYNATGITGCCTDIEFTLTDDGGATDAPATLTAQVATQCGLGVAYQFRVYRCTTDCFGAIAAAKLIPQAGYYASEIQLTPAGCGVDGDGHAFQEWKTDNALFCTGEPEECGENIATFRVSCAACADCPCADTATILPDELCIKIEGSDFTPTDPYYVRLHAAGDCSYWSATQPFCMNTLGPNSCDGTAFKFYWDEGFGALAYRLAIYITNGSGSLIPQGGSWTGNIACDPLAWSDGSFGIGVYAAGSVSLTNECQSFNCLDSGACIDPGDGTGEYDTLAECIAACAGGDDGGSGSGDCTACNLAGLTATLVVPDGPWASESPYTGVWQTAADAYTVPFWNTSFGQALAVCIRTGATAGDVIIATGTGQAHADTVCGPPAVMTCAGTPFGATGDCTVTT